MAAATTSRGASTRELTGLLAQFVTDYVREYGHVAERHGLSAAQARALAMVATPTSMRALAEKLYCDASNVTGIIARLESRGLVERQADPADRRVKVVVLTPAGRELHERVAADFQFARRAVGRVSVEERALLADVLHRMIGAQQG